MPPTPTGSCPKKTQGDANCNNIIDLSDFERFRTEYLSFRKGTLLITNAKANFNSDNSIDLFDFELFRKEYLAYRNNP